MNDLVDVAAESLLAAFGFGVTIAFGALFLVAIITTVRAEWFAVVRPIATAVAGTLPLFVLLFIPIAALLPHLYPFAGATLVGGVAASPHLQEVIDRQRAWMTPSFFVARSFGYLLVASILAEALARAPARLRVRLAAGSLPLLAFVLTFASFDWFMARSPGLASDMYGLTIFAGAFSAAVAVVVLVVRLVPSSVPAHAPAAASGRGTSPLSDDLRQALGKLLFVGVMLWGYLGFCQFLLLWIADLPHEIPFYAARVRGIWLPFTWVLVCGHFVVPFLALLVRAVKRSARLLPLVAGLVLVMHAADLVWLVLPSRRAPSIMDLVAFLLVAGLVAVVIRARLSPARAADPEVALSLRYESP